MSPWWEEAGDGPPVLLLHSTAADSGMWDPQWPELAGAFRVIRMDFRGYGRTPCAADGPFSHAGDAAELLDRLGTGPVAVVGASGGGEVALQLATLRPDLVSRLVLLNAGAGLPPTPELAEFGDQEDRLLEAGDLDGAVELNVRTWLGPEAAPEAHARLALMQRNAFELQLAAAEDLEFVKPAIDLTVITAPTLVVIGAQDLPYFRETGRHLARELASAELLELPWAGHLPGMERPEEITRLLLDRLSN
ncbi:alpha/beta fold hydrolase [Acrocarpospora catenulata]|uniref:alpha/beta fold hydrolase n=1 Tax=Acrocarpospora catenulata TaxID=2836182 RepID=UPI001BDA6A9C|nr:alpha/beta fold hydrolase [Acrocarpospora catenulata]